MGKIIKDVYGKDFNTDWLKSNPIDVNIKFWKNLSRKKGFKTMALKNLRYWLYLQKQIQK